MKLHWIKKGRLDTVVDSSIDSVMESCVAAALGLQSLYTGHCTFTPSKVVEWPRQATTGPIAKHSAAKIYVATFATPIVGGARFPITPPAKPLIVVLALGADPISFGFPPRLGKRTPFPAACHTTQQVVPHVQGRALTAGPHFFGSMLRRWLWQCCLLLRLVLESLRTLPHSSDLANELVQSLHVLLCPVSCPATLAPPWHVPALCALPWDAARDTGHSSSSGARG